jgi:hypothetical protein
VLRHSEIANLTAERICDDLAIPRLEKKSLTTRPRLEG